MKLFNQIGLKMKGFGKSLGDKIYSGSKYIGQKVYDNRYKIGAALASGLAYKYLNSYGFRLDKTAQDLVRPLKNKYSAYRELNNLISSNQGNLRHPYVESEMQRLQDVISGREDPAPEFYVA